MDTVKIGKFISENRRKKKLTQENLGEILGVNSRTISRWENGQCMPDLSLYDSICKELNITINEFLSGEHLSKDNYQDIFERNVIEVVNKVEKKNKYNNVVTNVFLGIIILFFIWFIGSIIYTSVKFTSSYNEDGMYVLKDDVSNNIMFHSLKMGNIRYISINSKMKDDNNVFVFVTEYRTLEHMHQDIEYESEYLDFTKDSYGHGIFLSSNIMNKNFKIYYTTVKFSNIVEANEKELKLIIESSHLMYENII